MRKRDCDCPTCKARNEREFFDIVLNPANGQWLADADPADEKLSLEERLAAYTMKNAA